MGIWGKNEKTIKVESRKSQIIFNRGDVFKNWVLRGWMGGFLGRAQDSELKIRVPGESRMLVAESWPYWWWMAAVERERDQESISQESRNGGWRPEQPEVRSGVRRHS